MSNVKIIIDADALARKLKVIDDKMAELDRERGHIEYILTLRKEEETQKSPPVPREELTPVRERMEFVIEFLKRKGGAIRSQDIFQAQLAAGIKVSKAAHEKQMHQWGKDTEVPIQSAHYGTYQYAG